MTPTQVAEGIRQLLSGHDFQINDMVVLNAIDKIWANLEMVGGEPTLSFHDPKPTVTAKKWVFGLTKAIDSIVLQSKSLLVKLDGFPHDITIPLEG